MRMVLTRSVKADPATVFAASSDFAGAPSRVTGIKSVQVLTPGPVGHGTKFKETRIMFGKEATETMEVVAWDPPRAYTLQAVSCGAEIRSELRFLPDAGGTRIELECGCRPVTLGAKLMSPLGLLFMGSVKKAIQKDLDDIARTVEAGRG